MLTDPNMQSWPARDVWAASCAAQRINGKYINGVSNETRNIALIWRLLEDPTGITDADREQADKVRLHFQTKMIKVLGGTAGSFDTSAAKVAQLDVFDTRRDVGFVACLPSSYERDMRREELDLITQPVGKVGERLPLTLTIDEHGYSSNYNTYWHTARQGTNRFFFFSVHAFPEKTTHEVTARVKAHRPDGTTQLHHVKRAGEKKTRKKASKSDTAGDKSL